MLIPIHSEITRKALENRVAPDVLEKIVQASRKQDAILGQFGHSEYHFDNNKIAESQAYIQEQREIVYQAIKQKEFASARQAFGRLIHTAQDLYAHSNYVSLWLDQFPEKNWPSPEEIDPQDEFVLENPGLRSGKLYYPLELLSFVPFLKKFVIPHLPQDSHAWMNLDSPESGIKFDYAFSASVKRTRAELEIIRNSLSPEEYQQWING